MDLKTESDVKKLAWDIINNFHKYNDVESIIETFAPDIICVGISDVERPSSLECTIAYLRHIKSSLSPCLVSGERSFVICLGEGLYLCEVSFTTQVEEQLVRRKTTFIFRLTGKIFKCVYAHPSVPSFDGINSAMEELNQKNHQMQVILNAVKGGLKISRDDDTYSYAYVSDELCHMFGYTKNEFMEATGGSAVGAVYPPDLTRVMQACYDAFKDGSLEYAIKYRIPCKDGSLKWIIDSGRKTVNESGNVIINSIYLDVTEFEKANQKIAKQKELLDSIYDSMMCGILRYRIIDSDFEFVSMNREALRLLGYKSETECFELGLEEFYSRIDKEDWAVISKKISSLKKPGDRFDYEYRVATSKDSVTWVFGTTELLLDADKTPVIQRVMIDITSRKELEIALEDERQRFRIAIESSPAIIFEYNLANDTFSSFGTLEECEQKHDMDVVITNFLEEGILSLVDAKFRHEFATIFKNGQKGEMELRMVPFSGSRDFVWAKATFTPLYKDDNKLTKVVGKIRNLQSEKDKEFALEAAKTKDGLTKLYTKDAGIKAIREYMENRLRSEDCVLMLLDMDNFKKINEDEGSVFADAILQEVALILLNETKPEDIGVRLGGDEFMLFVKDCNKAKATILGPRIANGVKNLFAANTKELNVSVSIGMCSTEVVDEYTGLYRCAESTLKYVKENSKGRAACYLDSCNELGTVLTQIYKEAHFINEISRPSDKREEDLTSFALELLGKSKSLDDAIFLLLSRIGKSYDLSRVSIMEVDHDYLSYRFSYQWAKSGADLEMDRNFYFKKDELDKASAMYDSEGLCTYNLNKSISHLKSCLHAAVWNNGLYSGSLSFEVSKEGHVWTTEQRKLMKEMTKIIFSFIMKARADAVSQAKTDFLSRMSHEIRTPMNAIAGMTTIAKTVISDKAKALDCLNKIESANSYLLGLINDILDMSRIESGKIDLNYESTDINVLIEKLESLLKPQAEAKKISFDVENLCVSCKPLMVDSLRLNQVLVNIVGNAVKFTKQGGRIVLKVEQVKEADNKVFIRFSVKDTGIGISKEAISRIFNAFEQAGKETASQYGGTGLGLSISSRLVQMMGGVIEVSSQVGQGSEFFFTVAFNPATEPVKDSKISAQQDSIKIYDFTGKRVLLAEDNELNREIAETILKMNGFEVESAVNGREALDMFLKSHPNYYDAVLMDIRMPIMDGLEATKRIRVSEKEDARHIPIIAMTANAFDEDTKKSIESGMNGHLSKPFEIEKLFEVLQGCWAGKK